VLLVPVDIEPAIVREDDGIRPGPGRVNWRSGKRARVWFEYTVAAPHGDDPCWTYEFEVVGDGAYPDWLDYERDCIGWRDLIVGSRWIQGGGDDDVGLDWLLREGILPGQAFCVEFTPHWSGPDYWTGETDLDIDVDIVARDRDRRSPAEAADLLEWAWALHERRKEPTE
jgi:hypothetical protein